MMWCRRTGRLALLGACVAVGLAPAAFGQADKESYDDAFDAMKRRNAAEHQAAAGNADRRAWDYVFADKKTGVVTLLACGSTIKPADPVEFFVATANSGRGYESLSVTFAKPSDIKAAMEFVGLRPGRPIDAVEDRYWPRGQRVVMTFNAGGRAIRAEDLVLDTHSNKPLRATGLVFAGSFTNRDDRGNRLLAADYADAQPIAPLYNNPAALLELPRQAMQSEVYGSQRPSAAATFKPQEAIDITIAAATGPEQISEWPASVRVGMVDGRARFDLDVNPPTTPATQQGNPAEPSLDLPNLVAAIGKAADGTHDLFTTVRADDGVPVADVRQLYAVLRAVEKDRGVKIEPPLPGELYFRAYFPDAAWRDRATRLGEPWELFLSRGPGRTLKAKLERSVDNPDHNAVEAKVVESVTSADPAGFIAHVNANATQWSRTIFIYPPADLTYGELKAWVRPVLATYPRVFVFPSDAPATRPE